MLKLLYACLKGYSRAQASKGELTKEKMEMALVGKLQGVFRPERDVVGRLVNRKQGSNRADITITFEMDNVLRVGFGNRQERHAEVVGDEVFDIGKITPVFIPPKEIISATENFGALYDEYHVAFEETYYDLARLLEKPLRKGSYTAEQKTVLKCFEAIVNGSVVRRNRNFYLKEKGAGEFEMGLVSEGYRKLSTIMYLILSGSLAKDSILFWDEPETNMNPKMMKPMVDAVVELAKMGVQVFIATHDYFIQQCFGMAATYQKTSEKSLEYQFLSLYPSENGVLAEGAANLHDLSHNVVMEEFDLLYDREQELLYGN